MLHGRCHILKDWPAWDYSVHEDKAQIDRQNRAMTYPFTFKINKAAGTARFSSSTDLPFYETTLDHCTCYDFADRGLPCKHIYRLAHELGVIEIVKRKSGYAVGAVIAQREEILASGADIDAQPEQVKRIEKAKDKKCAPISIDVENKSAIFGGSGKEPYVTTVDSCTCRDYFARRLPCKHIYRLRMELGLMSGEPDDKK